MRSWIRHILPFGLVRYVQNASELERLGVPKAKAYRLALMPASATKLRQLNLDLFPAGSLAGAKTVVDIGANAGDWTAGLLEFCTPQQVLCFEPDPTLAQNLRTRFSGTRSVEIHEFAIGDTAGEAALNIMEGSEFNSLRQPVESIAGKYPETFHMEKKVSVKVRTLDSFTDKLAAIDLLKIDTQGYEREVLIGSSAALKKTKYVLLEINFQRHYEGEAGFVELDACMQQNGFCIGNYSGPKGGKRQALFADFLYVRKND